MRKLFLCILIILISTYLYPQNIRFSKSKIIFAFTPSTLELADTLTVYNDDGFELKIDSIYSIHEYGYRLNILFEDTSLFYFVFSGQELNEFLINPKDSAIFIFSNPDLCPICKELPKVNAFTDSIRFHSNSTSNNYSNLAVEGLGYVIIDEYELPLNHFFLSQNYPNPFNPATTIQYAVKENGLVSLAVYDLLGREVASLVNESKDEGSYSVSFDASSPALGGQALPSGVYIYTLRVNDFTASNKMIVLK